MTGPGLWTYMLQLKPSRYPQQECPAFENGEGWGASVVMGSGKRGLVTIALIHET